jgi:hypothetical protein
MMEKEGKNVGEREEEQRFSCLALLADTHTYHKQLFFQDGTNVGKVSSVCDWKKKNT